MTACPHGMPSPASCLDCMDEGLLPPPPPPPRPVPSAHVFPAKFPGHCRGGCGHMIDVGDPIRALVHATGYVHDGCEP